MKQHKIEQWPIEDPMIRHRDDLIKPYLHYIDEVKVCAIVRAAVMDQIMVRHAYNRLVKTVAFANLPIDGRPNFEKYCERLLENYSLLPVSLTLDVFKLYYTPIEKLIFQQRTAANRVAYYFLEMVNDAVGKVMTESASLKSAIYVQNIIIYYLLQITQLSYTDPILAKVLIDGFSADAGSAVSISNEELDKAFGSTTSRKALDRALSQAQNDCQKVDETMGREIQEQLFDSADDQGKGNAGKVSSNYINRVAANLANIRMSMGSLKEELRKVIDRSAGYFSYNKKTTYEDLLNADDLTGLEDHLLLHPRLRSFFVLDAQIKEVQYKGKLDVYLDVSSSMSCGCGSQMANGSPISRLDFAKSMIAKFKEMNILHELCLFDNRLKPYPTDLVSISMIGCGGGTSIDVAVRQIVQTGRSAVVITDAEDGCTVFTEKAFFIGLRGADFSRFDGDVLRQYAAGGQLVVFDGKSVLRVNEKGEAVRDPKERQ